MNAKKAIHGVLIEVYSIGVLITGESGIGKSEAALELVRRGHKLISDDIVDVMKNEDGLLVGEAPKLTKHLLEVRGIGIINIKNLYGIESVKDQKTIELNINLEEWKKGKEYDRTGMEENTVNILDTLISSHNIPVKPGRNLAVIVEAAAMNYKQKKMGYNAAKELYERLDEKK